MSKSKRTRSYFRHHRQRVINNKLHIIKAVWGLEEEGKALHPWIVYPGKLSKAKLNCSCWLCKSHKHLKIEKHTHQSKLDVMQQQIDEYFKEN